MRVITLPLFILVLAGLILIGCSKNEQHNSNPTPESQLSIEAAKAAFDQVEKVARQSGASLQGPNKYVNTPIWGRAQWRKGPRNFQYWSVPLTEKENERITRIHNVIDGKTGETTTIILPDPWLMIYVDSTGKTVVNVVQKYPETPISGVTARVDRRFTGELKFFSWDGVFQYGVLYKGGQPTKRISPGRKRTNNVNARWDFQCYTEYICFFSATCAKATDGLYQVWEVGAVVNTTDGAGCSGLSPSSSPWHAMVNGHLGLNGLSCGDTWNFVRADTQEMCDWTWHEDVPLPENPNPYPDDPEWSESAIHYITVEPPPTPIDITDFLKCFNRNAGAKVTIYADQPKPGKRIPVMIGDVVTDVGHSFVTIEQTIGGNTISRTYGYYPQGPVALHHPIEPRMFADDANHIYDVKVSKDINATQLSQILDISVNARSSYNLFKYNCTDFVLDIADVAGWTIPRTTSPIFPGCNPGDLGEDMRPLSGAVKTTGNAPARAGTCN